jgi:hypothetical protein
MAKASPKADKQAQQIKTLEDRVAAMNGDLADAEAEFRRLTEGVATVRTDAVARCQAAEEQSRKWYQASAELSDSLDRANKRARDATAEQSTGKWRIATIILTLIAVAEILRLWLGH